MAGTGEAGKRGPKVRSDCWIQVEIRDSGGVSIDLHSKVAGMFGERIGALLEEGCRALGVDHARITLEDQGALPFTLAARLETACKQYSARIIVSEYTYKSLRSAYSSREIDLVVVKGKTKPVTIYEILDYHTEQSFPNLMDVINQFKSGLVNYRKQLWDKAMDAFKEALKANAEDKLSDMYIERCSHYKANPPGDDWDGVWVMKEK